jgi:serine/threonine protein kinase
VSDGPTLADGKAGRARAANRIGRFDVRKKLGEGGMGVVFEGYDKQLDREVALKLVRVVDGDVQGRARLMREAQAMAKVAHPNVVPIYEVGEHEDQVFVAMELVAGETLSAWLRRTRRGSFIATSSPTTCWSAPTVARACSTSASRAASAPTSSSVARATCSTSS